MKKKTEIDPSYYENNCLASEFEKADRNGDIVRPHGGKNALQVLREHMNAKNQNETVSLPLPKTLVSLLKRQANSVSVPLTSYMKNMLEVCAGREAASKHRFESAIAE